MTNTLARLLLLFTISMGSIANATDLKVGDIAPDFRLQGTDGYTYQLSHYKGKQAVVLAWYPMANTRGCTIECKSIVDNGDKIRELDVIYFMASVDPLDDNIDFATKMEADFPMLSDPTKETAKAYDVLNLVRVASRVTFYIDIDGKIMKIDEDVTPKTAAQDMIKNLKELGVPARDS